MKFGFLKAAAGSPDLRVADCVYNAEKSIEMMRRAAAMNARLLVLPELGLTGYTCADLFLQKTLQEGALSALEQVVQASCGLEMVTVCGLPFADGERLFNCAAVICNGKLLGIVPKQHLPNYGEFFELRWFSPAPGANSAVRFGDQTVPFGNKLLFCCAAMPSFKLGVEICEDLWVPSPPSGGLARAGATVIANLSASDEVIGKKEYRRQLVRGQSARLSCAYIYADAGSGESSTDLVFAGHDMIAENGALLCEADVFSQDMIITEVDLERMLGERQRHNTFFQEKEDGYETVTFSLKNSDTALTRPVTRHPFVPQTEQDRDRRCEEILSIQALGLKKRLSHTRSKTLVLGVSGGLDSTLALLVCARACDLLQRPHSDILGVTMPCFGTTARTRGNAEILCERIGTRLQTVDIAKAVQGHFADIGHTGAPDVAYENSQARERTQVLMDIANKEGGLVIGTGDLSELALGWATYNGDHMSMYGVNGSIPKTLVRHMVAYVAAHCGDEKLAQTLGDILDTPVSPELLPAKDGEIVQQTEGIVGPYELHDFFLYYFIRFGFSPSKIFHLAQYAFSEAYTGEVILKWLQVFFDRFFAQQFKRSCLPDGPKVGTVALSPRGDWKMPSDAVAAIWREELSRITPA